MQQKDALEANCESKRQELKGIIQEAEQRGRAILQQAKEEAAALLKSAERQAQQVQRRLAEVEARERGATWGAEQEAALTAREQALAEKTAACEQAKIAALTAESFWKEKAKELDALASGLDERERRVAKHEQALGLLPSPAPNQEKKSKKPKDA